jgi:THUMP domain-like
VIVCSDVSEYEWLTAGEAAAHLADLAVSDAPLHAALERLRGRLSPAKAHLLLEQVELRRRAEAKFNAAGRMFFTRVGLEQATDQWIARYKAARFDAVRAASPATPHVADLCCGIGGDLLALAEGGAVVGVDCNAAAAHFAKANCSVVDAGCADRATVIVGNVDAFDFDGIAAWHIDPDRRPAGRRTTSLQSCQPSLNTIERLVARVPNAAMKLAPATAVPPEWNRHCELEWISRGGECRQLVAWHGALAGAPGRRRATILPGSAAKRLLYDFDTTSHTIEGLPDQPVPIANGVGDFVFDIDPAVRAAHLQGALAAEIQLAALAPGSSYFTGDMPIVDPAISCFKIEDIMPLRVRLIAQHLRERAIGRLEIKKRGVDIDPESLRRELKLRGDNDATLLITFVGGRPTAILAHRVSAAPTRPIEPLLESNPSPPDDARCNHSDMTGQKTE